MKNETGPAMRAPGLVPIVASKGSYAANTLMRIGALGNRYLRVSASGQVAPRRHASASPVSLRHQDTRGPGLRIGDTRPVPRRRTIIAVPKPAQSSQVWRGPCVEVASNAGPAPLRSAQAPEAPGRGRL